MSGEEDVVVGSAPVAGESTGESELDRVRQRLGELAEVLRERFDRRGWEEYLRLRRAEKGS